MGLHGCFKYLASICVKFLMINGILVEFLMINGILVKFLMIKGILVKFLMINGICRGNESMTGLKRHSDQVWALGPKLPFSGRIPCLIADFYSSALRRIVEVSWADFPLVWFWFIHKSKVEITSGKESACVEHEEKWEKRFRSKRCQTNQQRILSYCIYVRTTKSCRRERLDATIKRQLDLLQRLAAKVRRKEAHEGEETPWKKAKDAKRALNYSLLCLSFGGGKKEEDPTRMIVHTTGVGKDAGEEEEKQAAKTATERREKTATANDDDEDDLHSGSY